MRKIYFQCSFKNVIDGNTNIHVVGYDKETGSVRTYTFRPIRMDDQTRIRTTHVTDEWILYILSKDKQQAPHALFFDTRKGTVCFKKLNLMIPHITIAQTTGGQTYVYFIEKKRSPNHGIIMAQNVHKFIAHDALGSMVCGRFPISNTYNTVINMFSYGNELRVVFREKDDVVVYTAHRRSGGRNIDDYNVRRTVIPQCIAGVRTLQDSMGYIRACESFCIYNIPLIIFRAGKTDGLSWTDFKRNGVIQWEGSESKNMHHIVPLKDRSFFVIWSFDRFLTLHVYDQQGKKVQILEFKVVLKRWLNI